MISLHPLSFHINDFFHLYKSECCLVYMYGLFVTIRQKISPIVVECAHTQARRVYIGECVAFRGSHLSAITLAAWHIGLQYCAPSEPGSGRRRSSHSKRVVYGHFGRSGSALVHEVGDVLRTPGSRRYKRRGCWACWTTPGVRDSVSRNSTCAAMRLQVARMGTAAFL